MIRSGRSKGLRDGSGESFRSAQARHDGRERGPGALRLDLLQGVGADFLPAGPVAVELDAGVQFMRPTLQGAFVVGATSDHLVVDVTDAPTVKLGEKLEFVASYTAIA